MNIRVIKMLHFSDIRMYNLNQFGSLPAYIAGTVLIAFNHQTIPASFCDFLLFFLVSTHVVIKSTLANEAISLCSRGTQKLSISKPLLTQEAGIVLFDSKQFVLFIKIHPLGMQEVADKMNENYLQRVGITQVFT